MSNNGTDRDVAIKIRDIFNDIASAVETINDHKFVPHILTQPTDQTVALSSPATFSVTANNVKSYQWQYLSLNNVWNDMAGTSTGSTISFNVSSETVYQLKYRCKITGLDNSVIYTDEVRVIAPES